MEGRYHTVIIVPHSRAKYRKWRVSSLQLRAALLAVALVTATCGFFSWYHLTDSPGRLEVERLRAENTALRQASDELEASFRGLEQQLADFEDQANSLAIVAGLDGVVDSEPSGVRSAAGGAGGDFSEPVGAGLDTSALEARTGALRNRLATVDEGLRERTEWIASQPSIVPVRGIFTSYFGNRKDPLTGRPAFHGGVDISAPSGKEVLAAADGIVVASGRNSNLGRSVRLSHGYGVTTIYGHLKELKVAPGQRVTRGDVIGTVGNSGRATGYHLHYEVRIANKPQDPRQYILE
jgi:murein DD-endopeptidase MepM/ murein hydrolase activator NlpD